MERIKEKDSAIFASSQTKGLPNLPPLPSTSSQSELYRVSKHVVYKYNFFIFSLFFLYFHLIQILFCGNIFQTRL